MTATEKPLPGDAVIHIDDVHFGFRGREPLFKGLNIAVPRGKITAIMGPSGSGKTALLQLIGGQQLPLRGRIVVKDQEVHRLHRSQLFKLRLVMGMLFQRSALLTDLNVFENVAFPLREHADLPEELIRLIVLMKLQAVGLRGARDLMPAELSGGMARRVALARAIAMDPEILFYDDPFSGQDPVTLGVLMRLIRSLNDNLQITSIIVSHDVEEVAAIADYLYMISDGVVADHGTPEDMGRSRNAVVNQFLHRQADGPVPFHYPMRAMAEDLDLAR